MPGEQKTVIWKQLKRHEKEGVWSTLTKRQKIAVRDCLRAVSKTTDRKPDKSIRSGTMKASSDGKQDTKKLDDKANMAVMHVIKDVKQHLKETLLLS